jgi:hypothetical protein
LVESYIFLEDGTATMVSISFLHIHFCDRFKFQPTFDFCVL